MTFIEKIITYIKKLFNKEEIKSLEPAKEVPEDSKKMNFIESIKTSTEKKKNRVETLICEGDGLGIQGKITY